MESVYTVEQVNKYIKNMFAQDFMLTNILVKGEVSNCKYHSSGHIYFLIKDKSGVLNCVMFRSARGGLAFEMEEGQNVIITGKIEVYEKTGAYQLYAKSIELEGSGALYQKYEALKKELQERGMFEEMYKRDIPKYATRIGICTAETGAAIQDIMRISSRRNPYVQLYLHPCQVQGKGAAESIVNGIHHFEQFDVDIIIVGRGGGSIEDLWAFNEEIVAQAIFDCSIPVISAVGHESDHTIADYVADVVASTPSAAAELAVFDYAEFQRTLESYKVSLQDKVLYKISDMRRSLREYEARLSAVSPSAQLTGKKQYLADVEDVLRRIINEKLTAHKHHLEILRLSDLVNEKLRDRKHTLEILSEKLNGLSPLMKISGGYAHISKDGESVMSVDDVKGGDNLSLIIRDGKIDAEVKGTEKGERYGKED